MKYSKVLKSAHDRHPRRLLSSIHRFPALPTMENPLNVTEKFLLLIAVTIKLADGARVVDQLIVKPPRI